MARKIKEIKTGKKQVKLGFYLDAATNEKLEQLSRRTMAPKARLLRKAVTLLLKEYK
jgi:predicted DNA-binding protein